MDMVSIEFGSLLSNSNVIVGDASNMVNDEFNAKVTDDSLLQEESNSTIEVKESLDSVWQAVEDR